MLEFNADPNYSFCSANLGIASPHFDDAGSHIVRPYISTSTVLERKRTAHGSYMLPTRSSVVLKQKRTAHGSHMLPTRSSSLHHTIPRFSSYHVSPHHPSSFHHIYHHPHHDGTEAEANGTWLLHAPSPFLVAPPVNVLTPTTTVLKQKRTAHGSYMLPARSSVVLKQKRTAHGSYMLPTRSSSLRQCQSSRRY